MKAFQNQSLAGAPLPRRVFLKHLVAASAASALPGLHALGADAKAPSGDRLNIACCGIGNRGGEGVLAQEGAGHANLVAFCDVDMGGAHTLKVLKRFPNVPRFKDFRQMFDQMGNQIDAVSIGVPDFSHFPIAMLAMSLGKHVYVEKPLAHTFQEIELMMAAEKKYKVVCQMGNQGHSGPNYFQFKAWVEAGIIKDVTRIDAFMNSPRRWHGWEVTGLPEGETCPETVDWEQWLSTAQYHAFSKRYHPANWRSWYDFGNGALGDWGAHIIDTAHRFLNLGLPTEIHAVKIDGPNRFIFPQASTLLFKFPARGQMPPVDLTWYDGVKNLPPLPKDFGGLTLDPDIPAPSSGTLENQKLNPGKVIYGKELTFKGGSHLSTLEIIPKSKAQEIASRLPEVPKPTGNHWLNFQLACLGREEAHSPFHISGPLSQVLLLGVIAQRLNTRLEFDRATRQFTNNKVANELLAGPPPRKGWEQFYKL